MNAARHSTTWRGALDAWVSVAVVNYNGRKVIGPTLDALRPLIAQRVRCIVVDDGSSDGSDHWVEQHYPEIRVVRLSRHFGKPSIARNRALHELSTPYIMLLDHDVMMQPGCLETLLDAIASRQRVFCCTARLVNASQPQRIYIDDSGLHYLCVSSRPHRGQAVSQRPAGAPIASVGGGNLLMDRAQALAMGGFDTGYGFGWGEDAELPQRARIMGWQSLHVPAATAQHVLRPHGRSRAEAQFYNRWRMMLIQYHRRTLWLMVPLLLVVEPMLLMVALLMKVGDRYARAARRIWRDRHGIMRYRRHLQLRRVVADEAVLEATPLAMTGVVQAARWPSWLIVCLNKACEGYWAVMRPLMWHPRGRRPAKSKPQPMQPLMPATVGACLMVTMMGGAVWMMPSLREGPPSAVAPMQPHWSWQEEAADEVPWGEAEDSVEGDWD